MTATGEVMHYVISVYFGYLYAKWIRQSAIHMNYPLRDAVQVYICFIGRPVSRLKSVTG